MRSCCTLRSVLGTKDKDKDQQFVKMVANIDLEEFKDALSRYPDLLKKIAKPRKCYFLVQIRSANAENCVTDELDSEGRCFVSGRAGQVQISACADELLQKHWPRYGCGGSQENRGLEDVSSARYLICTR